MKAYNAAAVTLVAVMLAMAFVPVLGTDLSDTDDAVYIPVAGDDDDEPETPETSISYPISFAVIAVVGLGVALAMRFKKQ